MKEVLYFLAALWVPLVLVKAAYTVGTILVLPRTKGALFVPTSRGKIHAILEEIRLHPGMKVVDLGCGDGRFLRAIWRRYRVVGEGFEINPWALFLAKTFNVLTGTPARVYRRNFFEVDLSCYEVVFCYLFPDLLKDLKPKLEAELRPGAVVISCNFPIPGWSPLKIIKVDDPIFIYRKF